MCQVKACPFPAAPLCCAHQIQHDDPRLFEQSESPYANGSKPDRSGLTDVNPWVKHAHEKRKLAVQQKIAEQKPARNRTGLHVKRGFSAQISSDVRLRERGQ
jgi:hypothetical protein